MPILKPVKHYSSFRRIALAQWSAPREPTILGQMYMDVTAASEHLKDIQASHGLKPSYGVLVGKAVSNALAAMPDINVKVVGRRLYLKQSVDVYYQVDVGHGQDLTGTVVQHTDRKSIQEIATELSARAQKIRAGKDEQYEKAQKRGLIGRAPVWLLALIFRLFSFMLYRLGLPSKLLGATEPDPFGSCMVTNVGNFGIDVAYAPLVPWTRVPYIFLVGQAREMPVVVDGEVVIRLMLPVSATIDHRVIDGARIGQMTKLIRQYVENPSQEPVEP
jgi:pyruvate/2-oxoglutarate dehydrogenase complex dihydrolipoamide acyltransferase (E2) component